MMPCGTYEDGEVDVKKPTNTTEREKLLPTRPSIQAAAARATSVGGPAEKMPVKTITMDALGGAFYEISQHKGFGQCESVISAILMTKTPVEPQKLRVVLRERLLVYPRFCARAAMKDGSPVWEVFAPGDVDMDWHVVTCNLPQPAGQKELGNFLATEARELMPTDRPLWRLIVFENFRGPEGRGAILCRLNHAIGDGTSMVKALFSLLDQDLSKQAPSTGVVKRKLSPSVGCAGAFNPFRLADALGNYLYGLYQGSVALAVTAPDPPNPFKTPREQWEQTVMSYQLLPPKIPLAHVKEISHRMGCTVNDVMVSVLGSSLGAYMRAEGHAGAEAPDYTLRMLAPVNMRAAAEVAGEDEMGNKFAMACIHTPLGCKDPLEALQRSKQELDRIKRSPEVPIQFFLSKLKVPIEKRMELTNNICGKFSMLFTNVPGPTSSCVLADTEIVDMAFYVTDIAAKLPVVTLITYKEQLRVGFSINPEQVKDPPKLMELFCSELERLRAATAASGPERLQKNVYTARGVKKLLVLCLPIGCFGGLAHCVGLCGAGSARAAGCLV